MLNLVLKSINLAMNPKIADELQEQPTLRSQSYALEVKRGERKTKKGKRGKMGKGY